MTHPTTNDSEDHALRLTWRSWTALVVLGLILHVLARLVGRYVGNQRASVALGTTLYVWLLLFATMRRGWNWRAVSAVLAVGGIMGAMDWFFPS